MAFTFMFKLMHEPHVEDRWGVNTQWRRMPPGNEARLNDIIRSGVNDGSDKVGIVLPGSPCMPKYYVPAGADFNGTDTVVLTHIHHSYVQVHVRRRKTCVAEMELEGDTLQISMIRAWGTGAQPLLTGTWSLATVKHMSFKQLAINAKELWCMDDVTLHGCGRFPSPANKVGVWFHGPASARKKAQKRVVQTVNKKPATHFPR